MSQSLTKLFVHIIFHVKYNAPKINNAQKQQLHAYINAIITDNDSIPIATNGTEDHIHILCIASKNITLPKLVENIKKYTSKWIKTQNQSYATFQWQIGYAAFSVSQSASQTVINYIQNQEEHHKTETPKNELIKFLVKHEIQYDEKYLFDQ